MKRIQDDVLQLRPFRDAQGNRDPAWALLLYPGDLPEGRDPGEVVIRLLGLSCYM